MTTGSSPENSIDIIRPFMQAMEADGMPRVQIMGGIGSAALKHPGTEILFDEKRIVTPDDFVYDEEGTLNGDLTRIRANGTLRDLDLLVLSYDPEEIEKVKAAFDREIGDRLDQSLFPLHDGAELEHRNEHPFGFKSLAAFVADRYDMADGRMLKALPGLFEVEIDPDTIQEWRVEVGGEDYPTVNPASAVMNYLTRSISGLRPKDADKVQKMARLMFARVPEMRDYVLEGPLRSQMELAAIFQTLRRSNSPQAKKTLIVGDALKITAGSINALRDNEAFVLRDADSATQERALIWAIVKSRGLAYGESSKKLVELYQRFAENRLDFITKNK